MHQQKVGLSAHRWLSNTSKYLQPLGLCYYLLIRRKVLLFTSKNKFECDRTSVGKLVSAVQWPMLVSLLFWVVPGLLPISERELKHLHCIIKAPVLLLNFSTNTASCFTDCLYVS